MAINTTIYSNSNARSKTVTVEFYSDLLASSSNGVSDQLQYFFTFTTSAKDDQGYSYEARVSQRLSDLVLNKQNQRISGSTDPYDDIQSMVVDYIYDYVHGHDANQWGADVPYQAPMNFSR